MNEQQTGGVPPRNKLKLCLLAVAAVPFVVKFAYLNQAWVSSPVDRARLGLWGSAALLFAVVAMIFKLVKRFPTVKPLVQSRSLKVLPLMVLMYVVGLVLDINAVQLVASVGILWSAAWALYGREAGLLLVPAAACAIMAVPGSSYWLGKAVSGLTAPLSVAYTPSFSAKSQVGYIGSEIPANDAMSRFFRTSKARQFRYASRSNEVAVLAVQIGKDIHEVHPATHCLRSSGWSILSEELRDVALPGCEKPISMTEALASNGSGRHLLMWVWYSSEKESTGSFIRFRRLYSADVPWRTYQVTTYVGDHDDIEAARRTMAAFLSARKDAR
ncbi:MAG: exosortase-associated EpsI family protein [Kiritimatiellae bacterium]|nr:exosortase-associated EpsI family protein [Kiritimatiellia bacterium]